MVALTDFENATLLLEPRRVMKYVLLWCSSGSATIVVDEQEFDLIANSVITITSGQFHFFKKIAGARGIILEFTFDFFCKNDSDIELVFHNSLFCHFAMNELVALGNRKTVEQELLEIKKELDDKPYQYLISIHSRIELILIEINRTKITEAGEIYKPDALFLKFLEAVRERFSKNPSAKQIASLLGTTEVKLNELSKIHTGKTAQNVIYGLVSSEAKRLFRYKKLSVKEVAYELGFKDPYYFSNFFKKQTRLSPKAFKDSSSH